jgi:adenylate cyclase
MSSPEGSSRRRSIDVSAVAAWLIDGARSAVRSQDVLQELCTRLVDCGLPLWRVAVFVQTLHPLILARRFLWRPGAEVEIFEAPFAIADEASFRTSPVLKIRATGETIRRRLADPACPMDYPILAEFREEGITDYLAVPLRFTNAEIHVATFTTRQAGGFAPEEVAAVEGIEG